MGINKDGQSQEHWLLFFKVLDMTSMITTENFLKIISFVHLFFYVFKSLKLFAFRTLFNFSLKEAKAN